MKQSLSRVSLSPPRLKRKRTISPGQPFDHEEQGSVHIRIFSWNVNGIGPLLQKKISFQNDTAFPLRAFLKRHHWPQFLCLQEVKINCRDEKSQHDLVRAANAGQQSKEPTYKAHFSLPRDKYNATGFGGKVYGVATLIRDDLATSMVTTIVPDWDLEGRVLIHEFDINDQKLALINGYWVNGTSNPYRNSDSGIVEGTRHDHKLRFHQYILETAKSLEEEGRHVILVGDMNVARGRLDGHPNLRTSPIQHVHNRADFNTKFFDDSGGLQGVDVFRALHGKKRKYSYHPRGCGWGQSCDRVDNIIVTKGLFNLKAVVGSDICDNPLDRGHSDHVPLWIEIDLARLTASC